MIDLKQIIDRLEQADKLMNEVDEMSESNDHMNFATFEEISVIVSKLIKCTYYADGIRSSLEIIPDDLYVNLIVLHNSAVDFLTSYEKFKKDTEVK